MIGPKTLTDVSMFFVCQDQLLDSPKSRTDSHPVITEKISLLLVVVFSWIRYDLDDLDQPQPMYLCLFEDRPETYLR